MRSATLSSVASVLSSGCGSVGKPIPLRDKGFIAALAADYSPLKALAHEEIDACWSILSSALNGQNNVKMSGCT
jgi:hypothetical protein